MRKVNIGIIGFGTVGSGVAKVISGRASLLRERLGVNIVLKWVCDKDLKNRRAVRLPKGVFTTDVNKVINDPDVDIVVELIGGIHPAKEIIFAALKNGKDVVTANKALLADQGASIFRFAKANGRKVYFEASVGGGIPVIKALREGLAANKISAIFGIINGTSNYVLSRMDKTGCDFKDALKEAQRLGYAERNPSLDINGGDSAHKLAILASIAFNRDVTYKDIYVEGISRISHSDIEYARELNSRIKLLAIAKLSGDNLELRVHPTLISMDHPLAGVDGVFNAVYILGDLVGEELFYGKGAGSLPAASAVISDIVDLAKCVDIFAAESAVFGRGKRIKNISDISSKFYIRFSCIDRPGVFAKIADILGKNNISIASVIQKERRREKTVPVIILTHEAPEASVRKALKNIDALSNVKGKSVSIRMEQL